MALSWEAHRPVTSDRCATIADGLAVRVAIPYAVETLNETVDRMLQVSERAIARRRRLRSTPPASEPSRPPAPRSQPSNSSTTWRRRSS